MDHPAQELGNWCTEQESGGLIGVEVKHGNTALFVMSAYLPTSLDASGMPQSFDSTEDSESTTKQDEAHSIYSSAIC